jgi:release factor glutamine methyltransferase
MGTGSGCLAVAIAHHTPSSRIHATDLSGAALALAKENAERHKVADRIQFLEGDGFAALPPETAFNLIVSNPPYIPTAEIATLAPEVRDYDPALALDGGLDGLNILRCLAGEGARYLRQGGRLMCEFGDGQADVVQRIFKEQQWKVEPVIPDLSGRARILVAQPPES